MASHGGLYEYTAIAAPRTIRLMHVHPGTETDPVQLSLETVALEDAVDYEAISYCWGNAQDQRQVTCNEAAVSITNSLFTAIVHFRHPDRPRVLWADAICINQADPVEKTGQVLLMPEIYSQATRVLIWLGVADDPVYGSIPPNVADSVRQALTFLPAYNPEDTAQISAALQSVYSDSQRLREEGKPNLLDFDWLPMAALLARPWFSRTWVVQEVSLARESFLYTGGGVEIPWSILAQFGFSFETLGLTELIESRWNKLFVNFRNEEAEPDKNRHPRLSLFGALHCLSSVYMIQLFKDRGTLLDGVIATKDFECLDPRDQVYSLLSLVANGMPKIKPDYQSSISDVFRRFAIAMLVKGQSLKILNLAPNKYLSQAEYREPLESLPSWVPDLRNRQMDILASYSVRPQAFSAGGRKKPTLSISDDQRILSCQGRVVDVVGTLYPSLIDIAKAENPEGIDIESELLSSSKERRRDRYAQWLKGCYHTVFGRDYSVEDVANPSKELMAFSRAMLCGIDSMRNRAQPDFVAEVPQYINRVIESLTLVNDEARTIVADHSTQKTMIEASVGAISSTLQLSVTENGRIARVPSASLPGDSICILVSGETPFVIRQTDYGTYTIIGDCYVDGIMDGEALETETGPAELETLRFE